MGGVEHLASRHNQGRRAALKARHCAPELIARRVPQRARPLMASSQSPQAHVPLERRPNAQACAQSACVVLSSHRHDPATKTQPKETLSAQRIFQALGTGLGACAGFVVAAQCVVAASLTAFVTATVCVAATALGALLGLRCTNLLQRYCGTLCRALMTQVARGVHSLGRGVDRLKELSQSYARLLVTVSAGAVATSLACGLAGLGAVPAVAAGCLGGAVVAAAAAAKTYFGWSWWATSVVLVLLALGSGGLAYMIYHGWPVASCDAAAPHVEDPVCSYPQ